MSGIKTFLSPADAARVLGVTAATVRLMLRRGALNVAARTEGGIHLLERREVEQLATERAERRAGSGR